jgi:hypothetical protein
MATWPRDILVRSATMNDYEIRIVRRTDHAQLIVTAKLMGDHAAVRRAWILADENDFIEVWRGATCVYSTARESVRSLT